MPKSDKDNKKGNKEFDVEKIRPIHSFGSEEQDIYVSTSDPDTSTKKVKSGIYQNDPIGLTKKSGKEVSGILKKINPENKRITIKLDDSTLNSPISRFKEEISINFDSYHQPYLKIKK